MSVEVSVHSRSGEDVGKMGGAAPRLFPANVCLLWHQNPLDLGTALNLLSLLSSSSDCAKACLGCMGAGPGRCKKCSPGYQQVGSKCLGECPANGAQVPWSTLPP